MALLTIGARLHVIWAYATDVLIPSRAEDEVPRLIGIAEIGSYRRLAAGVAVLLVVVAGNVAGRRQSAGLLTLGHHSC